jgi:hypothetical protein
MRLACVAGLKSKKVSGFYASWCAKMEQLHFSHTNRDGPSPSPSPVGYTIILAAVGCCPVHALNQRRTSSPVIDFTAIVIGWIGPTTQGAKPPRSHPRTPPPVKEPWLGRVLATRI